VIRIIGRTVPGRQRLRDTLALPPIEEQCDAPFSPIAERRSHLECKRCCHLIVKKGVWFITASIFKCDECEGEVRLTYNDKVTLFAKTRT